VPTEPTKAPRKTASQKRTERMADRHEAWGIARGLLTAEKAPEWAEGLTPYDVLSLAQWLAADND